MALVSIRPAWAGLRSLIAAAALAVLSACTQPAGQGATPGVTAAAPAPSAARDAAHERSIAAWGGAYADRRVQEYVSGVGRRIAEGAGLTGTRWRFVVLDAASPHAFTNGAGDVYVTRGILPLLSDESELAALLAHEMGHTVARHSPLTAERQRATLQTVVVALEQRQVDEAARRLVEGVQQLRRFSRENEFEADRLGAGYTVQAGYSADAPERMLRRMAALERFQADLSGRPAPIADGENLLSTHPPTAERIAAVRVPAGAPPPARPDDGSYLTLIDGLRMGSDPAAGATVRGRFVHPGYGIAFDVPAEFRAVPAKRGPIVLARDGAGFFVVCAPRPTNASARDILRRLVDERGRPVDAFEIPGRDAALFSVNVADRANPGTLGMVTVAFEASFCLFFSVVPERASSRQAQIFEAVRSVAPATPAETASVPDWRVQVVTAAAGDTQERLARRISIDDPATAIKYLRLLNELQPGEAIRPGRRIKLVVR